MTSGSVSTSAGSLPPGCTLAASASATIVQKKIASAAISASRNTSPPVHGGSSARPATGAACAGSSDAYGSTGGGFTGDDTVPAYTRKPNAEDAEDAEELEF